MTPPTTAVATPTAPALFATTMASVVAMTPTVPETKLVVNHVEFRRLKMFLNVSFQVVMMGTASVSAQDHIAAEGRGIVCPPRATTATATAANSVANLNWFALRMYVSTLLLTGPKHVIAMVGGGGRSFLQH